MLHHVNSKYGDIFIDSFRSFKHWCGSSRIRIHFGSVDPDPGVYEGKKQSLTNKNLCLFKQLFFLNRADLLRIRFRLENLKFFMTFKRCFEINLVIYWPDWIRNHQILWNSHSHISGFNSIDVKDIIVWRKEHPTIKE